MTKRYLLDIPMQTTTRIKKCKAGRPIRLRSYERAYRSAFFLGQSKKRKDKTTGFKLQGFNNLFDFRRSLYARLSGF